MKRKTIIIILMVFCLQASAMAQDSRIVERTYVSTDRDIYIAGDPVRLSAFCLDCSRLGEFRLSELSSIAYVELHNSEGRAVTGKIALIHGRGAGEITLPRTLPTGNYSIVAYTSQSRNENNFHFDRQISKVISVFNVFSAERAENGVEVVDEERYRSEAKITARDFHGVSVSFPKGSVCQEGAAVPVEVSLTGVKPATVSVSVSRLDGIAAPTANPLNSFFNRACPQYPRPGADDNDPAVVFKNEFTPDYAGEVIVGRVAGVSREDAARLEGKAAFLSAPGSKADFYCGVIDSEGYVKFFTNNIYGHKDMVVQIDGAADAGNCHIEIVSPFAAENCKPSGKMLISECISKDLTERGVAMQIGSRFDNESLTEYLPVRDNHLFGNETTVYNLDDYTRFPTMEETFVEILQNARYHRSGQQRFIQVRPNPVLDETTSYSAVPALVMVDGVPIFDHRRVMEYDPFLVKSIEIAPYIYWISGRQYDGIVNMLTYKANLPSMTFPDDVRVIDFRGATMPEAYTCAGVANDPYYPDYRQTLYWHPTVELTPGETFSFDCVTPAYKGTFEVVVEGVTADGRTVVTRKTFTVE